MNKLDLLTINSVCWHFYPIGTGVIFTYNSKVKKTLITCAATGRLINVNDKYNEGGYKTPEEFKTAAMEIYLMMIEDDTCNSIDLDFYSNPTYLGNSMIEVDLNIMKN